MSLTCTSVCIKLLYLLFVFGSSFGSSCVHAPLQGFSCLCHDFHKFHTIQYYTPPEQPIATSALCWRKAYSSLLAINEVIKHMAGAVKIRQ